MPSFPELVIVIVNYNLKEDTLTCIDTLIQAGAVLDRIIVVDNASTDGSVEALTKRYGKSLQIIQAQENRGYPHALNTGIPAAMELGAQWVLLTNNDVTFDPDFITELEKAVKAEHPYAMISPLILYYTAPDKIWFMGQHIIPGTLICINVKRGKRIPSSVPDLLPTDMMHGCAMLIRRDVFEAIGLFDDSQIIYGDDADFSWRARLAGFKGAVATRAKMWHKVSLTMNKQKPRTRYLRIRNAIGFYRHFAHGVTYLIMVLFTFVRGIYLTLGDLRLKQFDLIQPLWRGWWDGWTGNFSER